LVDAEAPADKNASVFSFLFPRPQKISATGGIHDFTGGISFTMPPEHTRTTPENVTAELFAPNPLSASETLFAECSVRVQFRGTDTGNNSANGSSGNNTAGHNNTAGRNETGSGFAEFADVVITGAALPPDGYQLEITERKGIHIRAVNERAVFYALRTLAQLFKKFGTKVPCLFCEDWPDLPVRGFMLDISRCKVPTMKTLAELVEQLAALRINQLQLYTEHTFAFSEHEEVWRGASPMTAEEYAILQKWCHRFGIQVVPNLQSFGHMERWLKHETYRNLAECPDGFYHELAGAWRAASTLKPNAESLAFMAKLYDEYLPSFYGSGSAPSPGSTEKQFNIGGDEPWELGRGWSKPLCEARGRHVVYREHLAELIRLCEKRGVRAQFWADILLEDPQHASEVPAGAVPVLWGYDAGHPFEAQCGLLAQTGHEYLVAPGASAWQTFHGRLDNALANVREAVDAARRHGARGVLLTSWGDNGNHQPWWAFYPALVATAALAWNFRAHVDDAQPESAALARVVADVFFAGREEEGRRVLAHGRTDTVFTKQIRNKSLLWELLFAPEAGLVKLLTEVPDAEVAAALEREAAAGAGGIEGEAMLALGRLAGSRVRLVRSGAGTGTAALETQLGDAVSLYKTAWRLRAREGGLAESVARIEERIRPQ
jgi:hypothetical protein